MCPAWGTKRIYASFFVVSILGGWCLINADGKGYRVGVFAGILNIVTGKFKGKLCTA